MRVLTGKPSPPLVLPWTAEAPQRTLIVALQKQRPRERWPRLLKGSDDAGECQVEPQGPLRPFTFAATVIQHHLLPLGLILVLWRFF